MSEQEKVRRRESLIHHCMRCENEGQPREEQVKKKLEREEISRKEKINKGNRKTLERKKERKRERKKEKLNH